MAITAEREEAMTTVVVVVGCGPAWPRLLILSCLSNNMPFETASNKLHLFEKARGLPSSKVCPRNGQNWPVNHECSVKWCEIDTRSSAFNDVERC
jgi:hypothetical protein